MTNIILSAILIIILTIPAAALWRAVRSRVEITLDRDIEIKRRR